MTAELQRNPDLPDRVRLILGDKKLTLHQVSEQSARLYGRLSPAYIPHSLYYSLRHGQVAPSLYQLCALSATSGYHLYDWLSVFGFDFIKVLQLQTLLPRKRTILLDTSLDKPDSRIPWLRNADGDSIPEGIVPLGRMVTLFRPGRIRSLHARNVGDAVFAKIGYEDALAFPELIPGSIVRVNPRLPELLQFKEDGLASDPFFLIEHSRGFWCSRLHFSKNHFVHPRSIQLPYAHVALQTPLQLRVHGVVDLEIRPMRSLIPAEVPQELATQWKPEVLDQRRSGLGDLLRIARLRSALSLREASMISRKIANLYGDNRYFVASGSLSDYEAQRDPPRHVHKIITLCSIYGIQLADFLAAAGIDTGGLGQEPIPAKFMIGLEEGDRDEAFETASAHRKEGRLATLLKDFGEIPFFLRHTLDTFSGIKSPSLRDFFWFGAGTRQVDPRLRGVSVVMVDRRKKKPIRSRSLPLLKQPLYMLLTREGAYICACCSLEDGYLVVDPQPEDRRPPMRWRLGRDAEVVGQVVIVARRPG